MRGRLIRATWTHDPTLYAPARYRRACSYDAFVPDPLAADFAIQASTAAIVSEAEAFIHALNARAHPGLDPLARLLLRTESIASSKVEGLQVDLRHLAQAEARADTGAKVATSATEILANIDAMQLAVEDASHTETFDVEQITRIHHELMRHAPHPHIGGQIRTEQNWIGGNDYNPCGADFVPPPPEHVPALLEDLAHAVNRDDFSPIIQAALVHAQFETIHPFIDGNGRTGRALIHVVLRRRGLAPAYVPPISVVLAARRDRYIAALTSYRHGDVTDWIEHFASAAAQSGTLATRHLEAVTALQARWRAQLIKAVDPRRDAAAWKLIDILPAHPVITLPIAVAVIRRTKPAVSQAITQLVDAGVLHPTTTAARNRTWEATGLLDLLAELDSPRLP